jgi:hypothetical protein
MVISQHWYESQEEAEAAQRAWHVNAFEATLHATGPSEWVVLVDSRCGLPLYRDEAHQAEVERRAIELATVDEPGVSTPASMS